MSHHGLVSFILSTVLVLPVSASAQDRKTPTIGFLTSGSTTSLNKDWVAAFKRGLGESGYVDGENVKIEYRGAEDQYNRLDGLVAEFVRDQVAVIIAAGGPVSALAAKRVTGTVPIVFTTISDPVKSGLVDGLAHPGGNITGVAGLTSELDRKRLEIICQMKPAARVVGVLVNPQRPGVDTNSRDMREAAEMLGVQISIQNAGPEHPLEAAFERLAEQRVDALVVAADPFFNFRRSQVIALAARYALPAIYQWRDFVADGGLMSYGPSIADAYYQSGVYAGRIIKGASPADLPVIQPTRFELVINRKTARSLGIEVSPAMLARATELIE